MQKHSEPTLQASTSVPLISILLVNFNGVGLLRGCLDSLDKVTYSRREVIVVDNGSSDDSLRLLEGYPWAKVVRSDHNLGFAGGNNLGLQRCSGDYVLLLNNDTVVPPDFLQPLSDYLNRNPEVGVVQGKMILPEEGNKLDVCGSFLTAFGVPYHYGYRKPDGPKYQRNYPVFSGKGACLMFRRELIEKVGGFLFDPDFFCYYEESDFCHRVWLAGYEVHFVSGPPIQHWSGATGKRIMTRDVIQHNYVRNMIFSLCSNLSLGSRLRIIPLFWLVLLRRMLLFLQKRDWPNFRGHCSAVVQSLARWSKIRTRRKVIAQIRKRSDRQIFEKALRTPRLEYFKKTSQENIGAYADDALD